MAETERHVRLFRNGRNQALRIPREFELEGDEAVLRKEGDRLIIEAKREYEEEEKKEEFVRHEMAYGRLYRSVLLPFEVLGDKARAEMKDGVLEIVLPKVESAGDLAFAERLLDGAEAARFCRSLSSNIEDLRRALL